MDPHPEKSLKKERANFQNQNNGWKNARSFKYQSGGLNI
jgi:hypothetical protein